MYIKRRYQPLHYNAHSKFLQIFWFTFICTWNILCICFLSMLDTFSQYKLNSHSPLSLLACSLLQLHISSPPYHPQHPMIHEKTYSILLVTHFLTLYFYLCSSSFLLFSSHSFSLYQPVFPKHFLIFFKIFSYFLSLPLICFPFSLQRT